MRDAGLGKVYVVGGVERYRMMDATIFILVLCFCIILKILKMIMIHKTHFT